MAAAKSGNHSSETDQEVSLAVETALAEVSWVVTGMELDEQFDAPYALTLELQTEDSDVDPSALLGTSLTLTLARGTSHQREVSGIVERVDDGAWEGGTMITSLSVVPALVALEHRTNTKIFQDLTVVEILDAVLSAGLSPYERSVDTSNLSGSYATQEYIVQYRETDLDFARRLMQEHGISFLLREAADDGAETLYLFDSDALDVELSTNSADDSTLAIFDANDDTLSLEKASGFTRSFGLRPTVARSRSFDWKLPGTLSSKSDSTTAGLSVTNGAALAVELEDYDHREPATTSGYRSNGLSDAEVSAELASRRGLHQRDALIGLGDSTATLLAPGTKFTLDGHNQADMNATYRVYRVVHRAGTLATSASGGKKQQDDAVSNYANTFFCVPEAITWVPERTLARPRLPGIQTATVVGPSGEEVYTDAYGRIKVQFHWDREGANDESSSCFIRVAQPLAGNGWGFMFLPRVGMEVVVTFIEGDLDRPVVTGSLYNGANSPPYTLPDDKTKSTIKTSSSPANGGYNELRFEDEAGAEEVYIRAERDFTGWTGNDRCITVTNDQSTSIGNDQTVSVSNDQSVTVSNDRSLSVSNDETLSVGNNQTETVGNNQILTVTNDQRVTVENDQSLSVTNGRTLVVGGGETHTVSGNRMLTVGGNLTHTVSGNHTDTITGDYTQTVSGSTTLSATSAMTLTTPDGVSVATPTASDWVNYSGSYNVFKFTYALWKLDLIQFAAIGLFPGVKADFVHVKVDQAVVKVANKPLEWSAYTTKLQNAVIKIHTAVQTIIT